MGVVLSWASTYPSTKDTIATNFPEVTDGTHDVMASHVNSLASAVVEVQEVLGGFREAKIADPLSPSDKDVLRYDSGTSTFVTDGTVIRADGSVAMSADLDLNFNSLVKGVQAVETKTADFTIENSDTDKWYDCDTDTAGGDITVTLPSGLNEGTMVHFSTKGSNDTLFVDDGVTIRGNTTLAQDKVASILYITSSEVLIMGDVT